LTAAAGRFAPSSRALHWLMAALILAMLFIGAGMAATVSQRYHLLVSIHKPLGVAILLLALVRLVNRLIFPPPPLPQSLPRSQQLAARASHYLLYSLMLLIPLIGWSMLSAADYPVMLSRSLQLAPILPPDPLLYALLRQLHRYFAWLLFLTILLHLAAALFHALIRRDGVFGSMAPSSASRLGEAGIPSRLLKFDGSCRPKLSESVVAT
jgi:cytochrome b561